MKEVNEIESVDPETGKARQIRYYYWLADKDDFGKFASNSWYLQELSRSKGSSVSDLEKEIDTRRQVLEWMQKSNISGFKEVSTILAEYAKDRSKVLEKAGIKEC